MTPLPERLISCHRNQILPSRTPDSSRQRRTSRLLPLLSVFSRSSNMFEEVSISSCFQSPELKHSSRFNTSSKIKNKLFHTKF